MSQDNERSQPRKWEKYASVYDPIKCASIDGMGTVPHDRAVIRAMKAKYKPNKKVVGDPLCTIFVGRLNIKTDEETVKKTFKEYGDIRRCRLVRDIKTGISKRYAFLEFKERSAAKDAVRNSYKLVIDQNEVVVEHEAERTLPGWKPRRLGGGFGGYKESGQLRFGGRARPFQRPPLIKRASPERRRKRK